jgi:hypothetical protein
MRSFQQPWAPDDAWPHELPPEPPAWDEDDYHPYG